MKDYKGVVIALLGGLLAALLLLELFLRFYDPFGFRLKGEDILLPVAKSYKVEHHAFSKLDPIITHTKNRLGFRGPELPEHPDNFLSLITVGGSTTECFYLSDGTTWPDRLAARISGDFDGSWLNNAGLDGHSTYGHLRLLEQHVLKLRPKIIIFMTGLNDIGGTAQSRGNSMLSGVAARSRVASVLVNLGRYLDARKKGLVHEQLDLKTLPRTSVDTPEEAKILGRYGPQALEAYRARIEELIKVCRANSIEPVFVTQPALFGSGQDPATGISLEDVRVGDSNGAVSWKVLELYNDVLRAECANQGVLCLDLARKMPKDSRYYYDFYHFTPSGAEKVAELIYSELKPFMSQKYPNFKRERTK